MFSNYVYAVDDTELINVAAEAYRWIEIAGVSIAVVVIAIYGIKWFLASPQDKAVLKSKLWVYIIGMILLICGANLAAIVLNKMHEIVPMTEIIPVNPNIIFFMF